MVTKVSSSSRPVREHHQPPAPSFFADEARVAREEEGTLGAVDCITFRGVVWKAALKGRSRASAAGRVSRVPRRLFGARIERYRGDRLPRGRSAPFVPSGVGHLFTTRGVRVDQVGVNPQWRAVAAVGVAKVNPQGGRDPWPETTRLARPRKGLRATRRASKPSIERVKLLVRRSMHHQAAGLASSVGVLVDPLCCRSR
jgi:hypothetical protein